jgi:hypothetical protein
MRHDLAGARFSPRVVGRLAPEEGMNGGGDLSPDRIGVFPVPFGVDRGPLRVLAISRRLKSRSSTAIIT